LPNGSDDLSRPGHSSADSTAIYPQRNAIAFETVGDWQNYLAVIRGVADEHIRFEMMSHGKGYRLAAYSVTATFLDLLVSVTAAERVPELRNADF
jgi:hypothetical protein